MVGPLGSLRTPRTQARRTTTGGNGISARSSTRFAVPKRHKSRKSKGLHAADPEGLHSLSQELEGKAVPAPARRPSCPPRTEAGQETPSPLRPRVRAHRARDRAMLWPLVRLPPGVGRRPPVTTCQGDSFGGCLNAESGFWHRRPAPAGGRPGKPRDDVGGAARVLADSGRRDSSRRTDHEDASETGGGKHGRS